MTGGVSEREAAFGLSVGDLIMARRQFLKHLAGTFELIAIYFGITCNTPDFSE